MARILSILGFCSGLILAARFASYLYGSSLWNWSDTAPTHGRGGAKNIGGSMYYFWEGCQLIFDDSNALATWFVDADANTRIIATLLEAVPLSYKTQTASKGDSLYKIPKVPMMVNRIEKRKNHLAKAKEAFKEYASVRQELHRTILSNKFLWYWYADNEHDVAFLRNISHMTVANLTNRGQKPWRDSEEFVRNSGLRLIEEHHKNWDASGIGKDLGKHLATMKYHLTQASDFELLFIRTLQDKSAKGHLWPYRQATDIQHRLLGRVLTLNNAYKAVSEGLTQMEQVMADPPRTLNGFETYEMSTVAWSRTIDGFLRDWGTFVLSSNQGTLFAARREKLKGVKDLRYFNFDASWDEWKERNCGGTSCYQDSNNVFRMARMFVSGPPIASRARDEEDFCKRQTLEAGQTPKVWRRVYEQACCQEGPVSSFLKFGPADTLLHAEAVA